MEFWLGNYKVWKDTLREWFPGVKFVRWEAVTKEGRLAGVWDKKRNLGWVDGNNKKRA